MGKLMILFILLALGAMASLVAIIIAGHIALNFMFY